MGIKFRDLIFYNREKREIKDPLNQKPIRVNK